MKLLFSILAFKVLKRLKNLSFQPFAMTSCYPQSQLIVKSNWTCFFENHPWMKHWMKIFRLKHLDLSYSTNVTDFGIIQAFNPNHLKCRDLEQIFLESTGAKMTSIIHLLSNLNKLEVVDSRHLGAAIDQMSNDPSKKLCTMDLNYWTKCLDNIITESENLILSGGVGLRRITLTPDHADQTFDFNRFVSMCPKLHHLIVSSFRYDSGLIQISRLKMLQHLCIGEVPLGIILSTLVSNSCKL